MREKKSALFLSLCSLVHIMRALFETRVCARAIEHNSYGVWIRVRADSRMDN